MFGVWGHYRKDIPGHDTPLGVPELAKALMESNSIPLSMHKVVCADDYDDPRLMDALHDCILAVHSKTRPISDSILTPAIVKLEDTMADSLMDSSSNGRQERAAAEMERMDFQRKSGRKSRNCCHKN